MFFVFFTTAQDFLVDFAVKIGQGASPKNEF